jgi:hypothetical protein
MNQLRTLGIVVGGVVAVFAIYIFGWHDDGGGRPTISTVPRRHHVYTLNEGEVVRIPAAAARCEVSQEAGIPNFYCVHTGRTRYQVFLWSDRADLYDLARHGEPMVPTYSVPGVRRQK